MLEDFLLSKGRITLYSYVYITFLLSICLFMDIWVFSTCWPLWINVQWTQLCRYLFKILISVLLDIYISRNKITDSYASFIFNILRKFHIVFCNGYRNSHAKNSVQGFPFLYILAVCVLFFFFNNSYPRKYEVIGDISLWFRFAFS